MMIKDHTGTVTTEALSSTEVKKRQQEVLDAYKAAAKDYKAGSASAAQPQKPAFRVVEAAIRGTDAKGKAEALAARYQKDYEKKREKAKGQAEAGSDKS